jgi:hypothetical protein
MWAALNLPRKPRIAIDLAADQCHRQNQPSSQKQINGIAHSIASMAVGQCCWLAFIFNFAVALFSFATIVPIAPQRQRAAVART